MCHEFDQRMIFVGQDLCEEMTLQRRMKVFRRQIRNRRMARSVRLLLESQRGSGTDMT